MKHTVVDKDDHFVIHVTPQPGLTLRKLMEIAKMYSENYTDVTVGTHVSGLGDVIVDVDITLTVPKQKKNLPDRDLLGKWGPHWDGVRPTIQ